MTTSTVEREALAEVVGELLSQRWSGQRVRAVEEDGTLWSPELWGELAKVDLLSLALDPADGGAGCGMAELRIVCEALGEHLALVPYVWSSVLVSWLVRRAEPDPVRRELATALAQRAAVATVALPDPVRALTPDRLLGDPAPGRLVAPYAVAAERVLLLSHARRTGDAVEIPVVGADALPWVRQPRSDLQSLSWCSPERSPENGDRLRLDPDGLSAALTAWRLAVAAVALGALRRLVSISAGYAAEREQFGRPIGSFQAVAHPIVNLRVRLLADANLLDLGCRQLDAGDTAAASLTAAAAKARATEALADAGGTALQVHGGHGFSVENDVQLYYRFGRGLEAAWGTPNQEYALAAARYEELTGTTGDTGHRPGPSAQERTHE